MQKIPVKFMILLGGFGGFCLVFLQTLQGGGDATIALRDGAIACVVGAILFRVAATFVNVSLQEPEASPPEADVAKDPPKPKAVR